ncbi:21 kDa protein-like [Quillaja saponaria]|uniref:21 kDa protein-like n=1 Tax=Quillaja saponaria TaxID=32244 RepID=A0AAD7P7A1_QUISA|nr:21 kDa protein-like [Quillaja saponaria]
MANLGLSLLVISLVLYMASTSSTVESAAATRPDHTNFIKASCRSTRYPDLCVQCLSSYANVIRQSQRQLALTALSVSIARARSAQEFVHKMSKVRGIKSREYLAVKDCIENIGDSVDRLSQSARELGHMGQAVGQDFVWHMSNVQTWVSSALTDDNTCLDGFSGRAMDGNVKNAIKRRVTGVAQVTSNALALVNRFAARRRTVADTEKP